MIIRCVKCDKIVDQITIKRDGATTYIQAHCHGETDTMSMTDEWQRDNQDFVIAINNNLTVGEAFRPEDDGQLEEV